MERKVGLRMPRNFNCLNAYKSYNQKKAVRMMKMTTGDDNSKSRKDSNSPRGTTAPFSFKQSQNKDTNFSFVTSPRGIYFDKIVLGQNHMSSISQRTVDNIKVKLSSQVKKNGWDQQSILSSRYSQNNQSRNQDKDIGGPASFGAN